MSTDFSKEMVPDTQHSRTQEIATRNGDGPSLPNFGQWAVAGAHWPSTVRGGFMRIYAMFDLIINGHFRNLNWRYLPYIRPI